MTAAKNGQLNKSETYISKHSDNETENKKDVSVVRESEDTVPLQRKLGCGSVNETDLNARSTAWMLERKASVGPCFRKTMPFGEPSGITISLPKKSLKNINENIKPIKSGITLTVSKKCIDSNSKSPSDFEMSNTTDHLYLPRTENKLDIKIKEDNCVNFFGHLKGKFDNFRGKIQHVLHM